MSGDSGLIGRDGEPIRAVTFAGGGFSTCLQLGVAHALLVSRSQAPDVVVGISAGAVNAVALADILQAGEAEDEPSVRLERRVERFREIFARYQSAPRDLLSELLPDSFQIDTRRPLEPLELPIHAKHEREQRDQSIHSRSGLMNVYNQLLAVGLPVGTLVRAIRRILGLKAVGEETQFVRQVPIFIGEILRLLDMVGANLHQLAPLVPLVLPAALISSGNPPKAASAGELIFQAKTLDAIVRWTLYLASVAALVILWLVLTPVAVALLAVVFLVVPLSIVARLAAPSLRDAARGLRRGLKKVRGAPSRLLELSGLVHGWERAVEGIRAWLKRLGQLPGLRWIGPGFGHLRRVIGFGWVIPMLTHLSDRRGFGWMKEPLRRYVERRRRRPKPAAVAPKPERSEEPGNGDTDERAWTPPPPNLPGRSEIYAGLRLMTTLAMRWLAWGAPIALLYVLLGSGRAIVIVAIGLLAGIFGAVAIVRGWRRIPLNLMRRNAIADGLLDPHPLRQLFVDIFDQDYYGKLALTEVVENALADHAEAGWRTDPHCHAAPKPRRLSSFSAGHPSIRVGVAAANIETGELETLREATPIVDALLAATAVAPAFSPQRIDANVYVDGTNIANEPTRPLLKFLRERIPKDERRPARGALNPKSSAVHMYTVSPLPISQPELPLELQADESTRQHAADRRGTHWPLVDVVTRALELQRFRDASLERSLTELYTRSMPDSAGLFLPAPPAFVGDIGKKYLRTWVYPIEPQRPIAVNQRLLQAKTEEDRRRIIAETVADGCRAALEAMIGPKGRRTVSCRWAIARRLADKTTPAVLPGSNDRHGPGLIEVCRHCALTRDADGSARRQERCRLVCREDAKTPPIWPLEGEKSRGASDKRLKPPRNAHKEKAIEVLRSYGESTPFAAAPWPRNRSGQESKSEDLLRQRATVSLLFSGGVFRGVYQVGVLNALSEVGLQPDIVAGASVGSITAAMAARVFASDGPQARECRIDRIRRLAATYMAIDRLVLTDRFSDFVRTMTVRAAQTRFSVRQIDRLVRQYDRDLPGSFERGARIVLAGLERLLYISPLELAELLKALRMRRTDTVFSLLKGFFQELLDRGGVGDEVLGSEPLRRLIREHVLDEDGHSENELRAAPLDHFRKKGIFLLATATNLSRGRLEVLGEHHLGQREQWASLIEGLLASSAFPGVFRPRSAREVMPHGGSEDLFTDGGVMDNLPLDAVARFLMLAAEAGLIEARPQTTGGAVPHLLFSASLEADPLRLSADEVRKLEANWPRLLRRTKRLSYNQKLQIYETAQKAVRRIWGSHGHNTADGFRPLDIEVVTVRPRWLCGTFAFHPMLGFRRLAQARSIAHGCASTLIRLDEYRRIPTRQRWAGPGNWGMDLNKLPDLDGGGVRGQFDPVTPPNKAKKGFCWFRPDQRCPFSRHSPKSTGQSDRYGYTVFELDRIHTECGRPETHRPKI